MKDKFSVCRMCGEPLPEPMEGWRAFCDEVCYMASVLAPAPSKPRRKRSKGRAKATPQKAHKGSQLSLFDIEEQVEPEPRKRRRKSRGKA